MATAYGDAVPEESIGAPKLTEPCAAENSHESMDVVDLLPGPIRHIIFRHLLDPPGSSTLHQDRAESLENESSREAVSSLCDLVGLVTTTEVPAQLQQEAGGDSSATTIPLSARQQHEKDNRRFGPSWPLLRCAMASKRLLHHVASFSQEVGFITLTLNNQEPQWTRTLSWFLRLPGLTALDLIFFNLTDLESLGQLINPAHSLIALCLGVRNSSYQCTYSKQADQSSLS